MQSREEQLKTGVHVHVSAYQVWPLTLFSFPFLPSREYAVIITIDQFRGFVLVHVTTYKSHIFKSSSSLISGHIPIRGTCCLSKTCCPILVPMALFSSFRIENTSILQKSYLKFYQSKFRKIYMYGILRKYTT